MGISRTFQRLELFWTLTVYENVLVAAELASHPNPAEIARQNLELLGIDHLADATAGELSTGSARLLEVARALATSPKLLLLDEPASGLDERESEQLGKLLKQLRDRGITVLVVEHDMTLVMGVCDEVYVLDLGVNIASGKPDHVRTHPDVIRAYLGAQVGES
jgi:branched-chain amino acid transport system ATP-binding protein